MATAQEAQLVVFAKTPHRRKNEAVIESVAFQGVGVFETLKEIARQVLIELKQGG